MESLGAVTFGFNLFKELNRENNGNIFFSPASILAAIGMLLLRTRGATANRLQKVLLSEKDTDSSRIKAEEKEIEKTEEIHHQFQTFLSEISKPNNNYELKIANRLFGEKTYLFLQKYLDYVEKYYHASLEPVDFVNAADESRKKINSWVESQTHENIKDLFPDATLSSTTTKLVLVNIVHFKGQWDREFKKEHTKEEEFWLDKNTSKPVQMMTQRDSFSFTRLKDLQAQILGIPYKNSDLSMFVLLPNDIDGLEKIINEVSPEKLVEWTNPGQMKERTVDLHLPRFEVEDSYNLEAALGAMGLGDAFSELEADYSGMSPRSGLHAQKFLHGSFVVVTEEGTEAAASTGMGFVVTSVPSYETFHCNHPFLFFIRHNESNSVLFFGKFSSP
ncbi:serpin B13 isoform X1 [Myotis lucifugus]|uniref:serpin B13 isoform X1 n=2 Tax=Myotis lucifugus TaxID=59463 RepID=UPI0006D729CC|nr:serpin B13 isoform X1 [Myotis lucifugus]